MGKGRESSLFFHSLTTAYDIYFRFTLGNTPLRLKPYLALSIDMIELMRVCLIGNYTGYRV